MIRQFNIFSVYADLIILSLSIIVLVVGLIRPAFVLPFTKNKTRVKAAILSVCIFFIHIIFLVGTSYYYTYGFVNYSQSMEAYKEGSKPVTGTELEKNYKELMGTKVVFIGKVTRIGKGYMIVKTSVSSGADEGENLVWVNTLHSGVFDGSVSENNDVEVIGIDLGKRTYKDEKGKTASISSTTARSVRLNSKK